jgi:hypothetical protein
MAPLQKSLQVVQVWRTKFVGQSIAPPGEVDATRHLADCCARPTLSGLIMQVVSGECAAL